MYDMCFACGKNNPISLGLNFESSGENTVKCDFTPAPVHQGYEGIVHGGIVSTLLDEAMVSAIIEKGVEAVTAELNVRFRQESIIGQRLLIEGKISRQKSRLIFTEARIVDEEGNIKASASAKFMVLTE
ncbi:MAG: PaaI family thioesterase [Bacillota bacterium]